MYRSNPKNTLWISAVAIIVIALLVIAANPTVREAQAQGLRSPSDGLTFVAFDTTLTQTEDIEAAQLAANLVVTNAERGLILIGAYGEQAEDAQSFDSVDEAKTAIKDIVDEMNANAGDVSQQADLSEMLETYAAAVQQIEGLAGGQLYVLSAGGFTSTGSEGLTAVAEELASIGVRVSSVSLATTPSTDREVLGAISDAGQGIAYDLGFPEGVIEFINVELNVQLAPSLEMIATDDDTLLTIDVPPHSSYLVAGFAFEDAETTNVIEQPNGQAIVDTVGSASELSISGLKFFTVRNPQPGSWRLKSSGGSGNLTFYSDVLNDLSIAIPELAPFEIGQPILLTADARSGELPLIDASATVVAIVTGPDGAQFTYELNDRGEDGDVFSEDGTFSTTVEVQNVVGVNEVQLSMRWPNISASIDGAGWFAVEPFPTIEINLTTTDAPVAGGEPTQLATVDLKLGEFPFLAAPEDVIVYLGVATDDSEIDDAVAFELEPTDIVDGKAYQFNVVAALTMTGEYEFNALLQSSHLDREFKATAESRTATIEIASPATMLWFVIGGMVAVPLLVLVLLTLRALFQNGPSGNLYRMDLDGERELVAAFADYKRSAWDWLINKPVVPAAALPGVPLLGGRFVFTSRGLVFRYNPESDGLLRMTLGGDALQNGDNPIAENENFQIGGETFVFDRTRPDAEVRVSERIRQTPENRHAELENFALDPMTWDAPSSARPTRRSRR